MVTCAKNSKLRASLAMAAALSLGVPALAPADFLEGTGRYFEDRGGDALDILRLRWGVPRHGDAYGVKARVTSLAQVGYVHFNGQYYGMERRALGGTEEQRTEGGVSVLYGSSNEMQPLWGNEFISADTLWSEIENRRIIRNARDWDDGRGHFLSVGGEVALPILGIDVGVYPEEAVDFVTSWFFVDLFNDDQLFMESDPDWQYQEPTTLPGPDLDAAGREKKAEMDAIKAKIEQREMLKSGQLGTPESKSASGSTTEELKRSSEERKAPTSAQKQPDRPVLNEDLKRLDEEGKDVQYPPATPPSEPVIEEEE